MKPLLVMAVLLALPPLTGCHSASDTGSGEGDTDTDSDSDTDTDTDSDTDTDGDSDTDTDSDTDVDTSTEPILDLEVTCEIETLDVEGEVDPPENNVSAVISCTFDNVGSGTIYLSSTFLGEIRSHPDDELMDSEVYVSDTYWDGSVLPDLIETNTYVRSPDGDYVSGMGGSDLFVIVVTVVDEFGHTLEVTTDPVEPGWGA